MEWTDQRIAFLKENWATLSAADIGAIMGTTRNSIIGKVHRLGLKGKKPVRSAIAERPRSRAAREAKRALLEAELPPPNRANVIVYEAIPGGISLMELESHHCRAVLQNGSGSQRARFCGGTCGSRVNRQGKMVQMSYCEFHARQYYQR